MYDCVSIVYGHR